MRDGAAIIDEINAMLDNHNVARAGETWACRYCPGTWPYPDPVPAGPCSPRDWADGEPPTSRGRVHPHGEGVSPVWDVRLPNHYSPEVLAQGCRDCRAAPGERCRDGRKVSGWTLRPHTVRRMRP